jgi:hypothetical protein
MSGIYVFVIQIILEQNVSDMIILLINAPNVWLVVDV